MTHYRITGRKKGLRGGAFRGFFEDTGEPAFGVGNLIHCPIWWDTTKETVQEICDKIMKDFPEFECTAEEVD